MVGGTYRDMEDGTRQREGGVEVEVNERNLVETAAVSSFEEWRQLTADGVNAMHISSIKTPNPDKPSLLKLKVLGPADAKHALEAQHRLIPWMCRRTIL